MQFRAPVNGSDCTAGAWNRETFLYAKAFGFVIMLIGRSSLILQEPLRQSGLPGKSAEK